ncbi:hypothetical protein PILCRDRAFT_813102 [Piloderma croceum F 1598]|uniref:Uncharacterized protein n=1 Tax=Piloderma croceum (strain F 1598) TaxID=765440 RepID=A0A0C3GEW4_PILCF|nr:hypothetical protein PILCRDRAFT_813102 [Piloderma croceum F 1598]
MTSFMTLFFVFLSLFTLSFASPLHLDARDVYAPPVTYPHKGTVWKVDQLHNVTWDTSNPPKQITNTKGIILLADKGILDVDNPLAQGFNILQGHVVVKVPNVKPGKEFAIVLIGDSGNTSPRFTIESA